jgi:hypothetical protein
MNLVSGIGELDICSLCDASPHKHGCPYHPSYGDERISYARRDAPKEVGPASFWVEETFVAAAIDAGLDERSALIEGIIEFENAIDRGEIRRI